jgi:DNA polymerase-3 subunit delta
MSVYDRTSYKNLLNKIKGGSCKPVYLLCGDRFLCRQAADNLGQALCENGGTVHTIDGDHEDIHATVARLRSFSLLPGKQVFRVNSSRLFHSKKVAKSLWNRASKAREEGKTEQTAAYLRAMLEAGGLDSTAPDNTPGELSAAQWKKCFSFEKPAGKLGWTAEILQTVPAPKRAPSSGNDPAEQLCKALEDGVPEGNILLLLAEEVDKRKKIFKFFKKIGSIVDLSVDSGASFQAKKVQQAVLREQINTVLQEMHKTMEPQVIEQLLERVGFHPLAVVTETEKLALYSGDASRITLDDLNAVVGRTRQEALFELTQAIGEKNIEQVLLVASRLQENSIHALAIIATLRNFTRKLLLFASLLHQQEYGISPAIPAKVFQQQCLPALKKNPRWKKELSGHPFAVYMQFKTASTFPIDTLTSWMKKILQAEMRLKGSPVAAATVIQHLLLSMLVTHNKGHLQNQR